MLNMWEWISSSKLYIPLGCHANIWIICHWYFQIFPLYFSTVTNVPPMQRASELASHSYWRGHFETESLYWDVQSQQNLAGHQPKPNHNVAADTSIIHHPSFITEWANMIQYSNDSEMQPVTSATAPGHGNPWQMKHVDAGDLDMKVQMAKDQKA